jgi:hypothetical protein
MIAAFMVDEFMMGAIVISEFLRECASSHLAPQRAQR